MSSFVENGIQLLYDRIEELNVLVEEANNCVDTPKLYSALCRSIQVLMVSHFEGYLKDLVKNILDDINSNSHFRHISNDLKFTFCKKFILPLENGKVNDAKILELIAVLDSLDTKLIPEPFYQENKNPKEGVINNIAQNFGEKKIFLALNNSDLAVTFSNTNGDNQVLRDRIKGSLISLISTYPYQIDSSLLNVDEDHPSKEKLWETFIQEILRKRHKIAHGDTENTVSHASIAADIVKIELFLLAVTYLLCKRSNPLQSR